MLKWSLALLVLSLACGPATTTSSTSPPDSKSAESDEIPPEEDLELLRDYDAISLSDSEGVRVDLVPVRSRNEPDKKGLFLLRATGTDSEFDGLVVRVERSATANVQFFYAHMRGSPYLILDHDKRAQHWGFKGYDYSTKPITKLLPTDRSVDIDAVMRLRISQRGTPIRHIEPTSRKEMQNWQSQRFEEMKESLQNGCAGTDISIDWSGVSDEMFQKEGIAVSCSPIITAVNIMCMMHPRVAQKIRSQTSFVCAYQGTPNDVGEQRIEHDAKGRYVYVPGNTQRSVGELLFYLRGAMGELDTVLRVRGTNIIIRYEKENVRVYTGTSDAFYLAYSDINTRPQYLSLPSGATSASLTRLPDSAEWKLKCGQDPPAPVESIKGNERQRILASAKIQEEPLFKRAPYFLARDDRGTYYYVDYYLPTFGGGRYRVFVGRRGQMKLTELKGLVEDLEGTLFSTDSGDLRLVVNRTPQVGTWIRGKRKTQLTTVDVHRNRQLIFDELGVYYGEEKGFLCD